MRKESILGQNLEESHYLRGKEKAQSKGSRYKEMNGKDLIPNAKKSNILRTYFRKIILTTSPSFFINFIFFMTLII